MRYMVGNPKDIDVAGKALKASRAPQAGALQFKTASTSKVEDWWAPKGDVPYLVIQGGSAQAAPPENGELLKKDLGDRVTLITLPDAGHLLVVTRPKEVTDAMVGFLKGLSKK
jgi:pimeloyl-ACP methyl ester carboxylesterase